MSSFFTKTTLLTLFTLCLQCFVSCSKDWAELSGDNSKEPGWMSISISWPMSLSSASFPTRAAANSVADGNTGDTYVGSAGDNGINFLMVGIYNIEGECVQGFRVESSDVIGGSFQRNPFQVKAHSLKPGNYYVFVAANPHIDLVNLISNRRPLSELTRAADGQRPNRMASRSIVMMCSQELTPLVDWRIYSTKPAAEAAPLHVFLERTVAKIFVSPQANQTINAPNAAGGKATMVDFNLTGLNNMTYYLRLPAQALKTNGTPTTDAVLTREDGSTPSVNRYSTDPNMAQLSEAEQATQFTYATQINRGETSPGGWEDNNGLFATENTVNADNQNARQLTHIVVKLRYIPKPLPVGTTTWAYYKGVYMDYSTLESKFRAAREANSTDESMDMPSGWKATVAELYNNSVKVNNTDAPSFDRYGLKFYKDGYSYYLVPIRHFDDRQQPKIGAYGRYGVVRNHLYKITINSVSAPGYLEVPKPEDVPVDKVPTYVSANVTVLPWTQVQQEKVVLE